MKKTSLFAALLALGCVAFPHRSPAPLTIRQGEGATYTAPGAEEVPNERDAQTQFDRALAAEKAGKDGAAIGGYRKTVKRFPKSQVAASAQFRIGASSCEKHKDYNAASVAYEKMIVDYPHSADFNTALEGEFNLGTAYLEGARQKVLGVPTLPSRDRSIAIYKVITYNAPYSRYLAARPVQHRPGLFAAERLQERHRGLPDGRGQVSQRSDCLRRALPDRLLVHADHAERLLRPQRRPAGAGRLRGFHRRLSQQRKGGAGQGKHRQALPTGRPAARSRSPIITTARSSSARPWFTTTT